MLILQLGKVLHKVSNVNLNSTPRYNLILRFQFSCKNVLSSSSLIKTRKASFLCISGMVGRVFLVPVLPREQHFHVLDLCRGLRSSISALCRPKAKHHVTTWSLKSQVLFWLSIAVLQTTLKLMKIKHSRWLTHMAGN